MVSNATNLEDLAALLHNQNLQLHTTGSNVYRILPNKCLTDDGKRHLNSFRSNEESIPALSRHPDTEFVTATIEYLEELIGMLGPNEVSYNCQNNLFRVPIGLALSNAEKSPLVMHIEEMDPLTNSEDYISPPAHKLILSVTGAMEVMEYGFRNNTLQSVIKNVGPSYISIRAAESHPSVALQRLRDMKLMRQVSIDSYGIFIMTLILLKWVEQVRNFLTRISCFSATRIPVKPEY